MEKRNNLKGISKAISVFAKIIKVCIIIAIVSIAFTAVVLPFVVKNIKVVGNENIYKNIFHNHKVFQIVQIRSCL